MKRILILLLSSACTLLPIVSNAEDQMPASTPFAIDLYHQLDSQPGNLFFSPFSIRTALAMTAAGAKRKTLEQIQTVLGMQGHGAIQNIGQTLRDLAIETKEDRPRLTLRVANALWGQKNYPFDPAFVKIARDEFLADAESVDFANEPAARKQINDWVDQKTNHKIQDLISSGALQADTRLLLTNAVYFNARWSSEFSNNATTDQPFHVTSDKTTTVPMMRQVSHFAYTQTPKLEAIQLMYEGFDASMIVLLPKDPDGIGAIEKSLSPDDLAKTLRDMKSARVDLFLPRFRIEQTESLAKNLQAMGMKLAFDRDHADFGGMCTAEPLFIADVLHKAYVSVDEQGTEAAAATAILMGAGAARIEEKPIRVVVDHPFIFVIRHERTGEILFIGRVMNPAN